MKRWQQLEQAVEDLLKIKNIPYKRFQFQCFKCKQILNAKASGMPDFFLLKPMAGVECKTGEGEMSFKQKLVRNYFTEAGLPFIELHDSVDKLVDFLESK